MFFHQNRKHAFSRQNTKSRFPAKTAKTRFPAKKYFSAKKKHFPPNVFSCQNCKNAFSSQNRKKCVFSLYNRINLPAKTANHIFWQNCKTHFPPKMQNALSAKIANTYFPPKCEKSKNVFSAKTAKHTFSSESKISPKLLWTFTFLLKLKNYIFLQYHSLN